MPDRHARRRAGAYRHRAHQLTEKAAKEWQEDRRRHLLELATQYQRAADTLASPAPATALKTELRLESSRVVVDQAGARQQCDLGHIGVGEMPAMPAWRRPVAETSSADIGGYRKDRPVLHALTSL
jgi:hypothetical protein